MKPKDLREAIAFHTKQPLILDIHFPASAFQK